MLTRERVSLAARQLLDAAGRSVFQPVVLPEHS